jgi:hypothetical protein
LEPWRKFGGIVVALAGVVLALLLGFGNVVYAGTEKAVGLKESIAGAHAKIADFAFDGEAIEDDEYRDRNEDEPEHSPPHLDYR